MIDLVRTYYEFSEGESINLSMLRNNKKSDARKTIEGWYENFWVQIFYSQERPVSISLKGSLSTYIKGSNMINTTKSDMIKAK